jgi:hypothetical protein
MPWPSTPAHHLPAPGQNPQQHHGRLQTLVCWQRSDAQRADIVYAAWTAGVRMLLTEFAFA